MERAPFELDIAFVLAGAVCGALCVAGATVWWHFAGPGDGQHCRAQHQSCSRHPASLTSLIKTGRNARHPAHALALAQGKGAEGSEAERQYVQQSQDQERAHVVDLGHAARAASRDGARAIIGKGVLIRTLTQNEGSTISPGPHLTVTTCASMGSCDVLVLGHPRL